MGPFNLSDKERKEIQKQHDKATKDFYDKKKELKEGLKKPDEKKKTSK